jgi:RecA-family ATPase
MKADFDPRKFAEEALRNAREANPPEPLPPLSWIDTSSWDQGPDPEREWFIRDRIPIRQPTLLSGEGAVGKSLLTLHLLAATALGRDWLGMLPDPGPAWYFGAEDDELELRIRLIGIKRHFGASYEDLAEAGFRMKSLYGEDAVLGAPNRSGIIEPTQLYQQIFEEACDVRPKCIALDASADMFAGNEIDRSQVRQFVGLLRKLAGACNGAVILLSHPSITGVNSGSGLSGSTAWHNSVRSRLYLTSPKAEPGEPPDSDLRELSHKKSNYGPVGNAIVLRYKNGLFLPEAGSSSFEKAERELKAEDAFLAGLRKLIDEGQSPSPQTTSVYYAPRLMIKVANGFRLKELEAAQGRLLDKRQVHVRKEGKPSRQTPKLYPGPPADARAEQVHH